MDSSLTQALGYAHDQRAHAVASNLLLPGGYQSSAGMRPPNPPEEERSGAAHGALRLHRGGRTRCFLAPATASLRAVVSAVNRAARQG